MNTIKTEKLKLSYGEKVIVPEMNITIDKPEIITIIGPNGSGKSTLLKGIVRLLKPAAGYVLLNGKDIHQLPSKEVAQTMAVLPQTVSSPGDMTVLDLITCGRSPYRGLFKALSREDRHVIDEAISLTMMEKFTNRRLDTLSGGERQRAWLAMALAQQPKILLLDEPTSYLDIRHQLELMKLIRQLYQRMNITIIMVLHDLNHAARYSHRIIAMKNGTVYQDGPVDVVFTAETLKFLYEVEAVVMNIEQEGNSHLVCFTHDISSDCRAG